MAHLGHCCDSFLIPENPFLLSSAVHLLLFIAGMLLFLLPSHVWLKSEFQNFLMPLCFFPVNISIQSVTEQPDCLCVEEHRCVHAGRWWTTHGGVHTDSALNRGTTVAVNVFFSFPLLLITFF